MSEEDHTTAVVQGDLDDLARPESVRQFFGSAKRHLRWELNDPARRLDEQPAAQELCDESLPAPASSDSGLTPDGCGILAAIDSLREGELETFDLVRIEGMAQSEVAEVFEASVMMVVRRLNRSLPLLAATLGDLDSRDEDPAAS
jgi:RNA polymerase sigma-70 factor (ECF subfamily)